MSALLEGTPGRDVLELLLPEFEPAQRERARKVVTLLRLLSSDARRGAAGAAGVDLDSARHALDREQRGRVVAALEALLVHHLRAHVGDAAFSRFGAVEQAAQAAWDTLAELREDGPWLCALPGPGEGALSVAERALASLERVLRHWPLRAALWRARLLRAREGPRAGASALGALALEARDEDAGVSGAARAGACEALLDAGAVLEARALLDEAGASALADASLRRLAAWVRLLCGDREGARALAAGAASQPLPLPAALAELAEHLDEPLLASAPRRDEAGTQAPEGVPPECVPGDAWGALEGEEHRERLAHAWRTRLGCAALAVFRLEGLGQARAVAADAAPGLRARLERWLAEREGACAEPSELEHGMVLDARPRACHAAATAPPCGALGPAIRAAALAPIRASDRDDVVAGWLRVECEHHLLPTRALLARAAQAWRLALLRPRALGSERPGAAAENELDPSAAPQAALFAELVHELRTRTALRRWWGFDLREGRAVPVAHGGAGEHPPQAQSPSRLSGGGKILERAALSGGPAWFLTPDAELALCADSSSGLVLPLASADRICGLFALESTRQRDFSPELAQRLQERVRPFGARLRSAQFRHWHRTIHGEDVHVPTPGADAHGLVRDLIAAGRARAAVALSGAPGAGRRLAARRVHFEGLHPREPLLALDCGALAGGGLAALELALEEAGAGSVLLEEPERLSRDAQSWLGGALESQAAPRWIVTLRGSVGAALREGRLELELGQRLLRLEIRVPGLAERREEIPAWVELFAERSARTEGLRAPSFEDASLALLWRQPWVGNLPELEGLVYKLTLHAPGRRFAPDELLALARRWRVPLIAKLPTRRLEPAELLAALRTTRNACGSLNKTRAALYLGWDPDTLVARMQSAGIPLDLRFEPLGA